MSSDEKVQKPVELSSIINVVQHDHGHKSSHRKMELKSVVHIANDNQKRSSGNGAKGHDTKRNSSEKPKLLLPFGHQVSGRASMLCYDETTILKPYVSRELFFYQSMPQRLKKFTPEFCGLVTVSFIEDATTASVLAYALPGTLVRPNARSLIKLFTEVPKPHSKRCVKDFGKTHVIYPEQSEELNTSFDGCDENQNLFVEAGEFNPVISDVKEDDEVVSELSQGFDVTVCIDDKSPGKENLEQNFSTTGLQNPWNSKVLDDAWLKLKFSDADNPSNGKKKRFTLMENVVARYRRPCVLDLKIGTRVRENASPEKIARHVTAINLGARLSGMQIYHPAQEKFAFHNKYYGHNLTVAGFKSNLRHFFSRGMIPIKDSPKKIITEPKSSVDQSLVKQAIEKLTKLKEAVQVLESHRFYSSSLLLLYEGDGTEDTMGDNASPMEEDETEMRGAPETNVQNDNVTSTVDDENILKIDISESEKVAPRSFSFSDFLHRLASVKHGKRTHENTKNICDTAQDPAKKSNRKHSKNSVHKHEKYRRKSNENDDKADHDYSSEGKGDFNSQSWPPRSKSASKSRSKSQYTNSKKEAEDISDSPVKSTEESCMDTKESLNDSSDHQKCSHQEHSSSGSHDKCSHQYYHRSCSHKTRSIDCAKCSHKYQNSGRHGKCSHCRRHHSKSSHCDTCTHRHHSKSKNSHQTSRESLDDEQKTKAVAKSVTAGDRKDVIDVRMIDFAHYCFHDSKMHPGPDGGFLFGLESLIKVLTEMLKLND